MCGRDPFPHTRCDLCGLRCTVRERHHYSFMQSGLRGWIYRTVLLSHRDRRYTRTLTAEDHVWSNRGGQEIQHLHHQLWNSPRCHSCHRLAIVSYYPCCRNFIHSTGLSIPHFRLIRTQNVAQTLRCCIKMLLCRKSIYEIAFTSAFDAHEKVKGSHSLSLMQEWRSLTIHFTMKRLSPGPK